MREVDLDLKACNRTAWLNSSGSVLAATDSGGVRPAAASRAIMYFDAKACHLPKADIPVETGDFSRLGPRRRIPFGRAIIWHTLELG